MYRTSNCSTLHRKYLRWSIKTNERCNQGDYQTTDHLKTESNKKGASFPSICPLKPVLCRLEGDGHSCRSSSRAAASGTGPDSSINSLRISTCHSRKIRIAQVIKTAATPTLRTEPHMW
ncbi:hypothetical protein PISMIDRAFT_412702 [Pisolithus microcarpus 441]|uniref:Uncharacterized protein n=1 Tax=Pisolithus microcarpus 441 TaxID=765257 RepID=A0A0C9YH84_9AGAM|nr:hypothetical protein PISMIDRAFT_678382 [Pisolithus microcarpus 441]KIK24351.1 hypothetical protein PISMIDRAFT_412702 [Pisolithus microcarpus 441]